MKYFILRICLPSITNLLPNVAALSQSVYPILQLLSRCSLSVPTALVTCHLQTFPTHSVSQCAKTGDDCFVSPSAILCNQGYSFFGGGVINTIDIVRFTPW